MVRISLALAVLCAWSARAAAPSYAATGIVNASNYEPGPFAPNSVVTIFGTGLARSTHALVESDLVSCSAALGKRCLPRELNYVRVYVNEYPMPLLFVSEKQINFVMSSLEPVGPARIRVVTQGLNGPEVVVTLVNSAPALFALPGNFAIATDKDGKLLTGEAPARAGDIVVIYATGLGMTSPNPTDGEIPTYAASALPSSAIKVALNGTAVDAMYIKYAGLTPGCAGLYQFNLELPANVGADPEIRVSAGSFAAPSGLKLAVR